MVLGKWRWTRSILATMFIASACSCATSPNDGPGAGSQSIGVSTDEAAPSSPPSTEPSFASISDAANGSKGLVQQAVADVSGVGGNENTVVGKPIPLITIGLSDFPNIDNDISRVLSRPADKQIVPIQGVQSGMVTSGMTLASTGDSAEPQWKLYRFGGSGSAEARLLELRDEFERRYPGQQITRAIWVQQPYDTYFLVTRSARGTYDMIPLRSIQSEWGLWKKGVPLDAAECLQELNREASIDKMHHPTTQEDAPR